MLFFLLLAALKRVIKLSVICTGISQIAAFWRTSGEHKHHRKIPSMVFPNMMVSATREARTG